MLLPTISWISFLITSVKALAIPQSAPALEHVRCPANDGTQDLGTLPPGSQINPGSLPTFNVVLVPTASWLQQITSGPDGEGDPSADPPPSGRRKRDEVGPNNGIAFRDKTLTPRAGLRYFEAPGYRQLSLQAGLIAINGANAATGGALVNVVQFAAELGSFWHGDHKLELNLLNSFLLASRVRPGYDTYNYPHIWQTLIGCSTVTQRVTDILNSPGNLIGVSSDINLLKMVLLQHGGPRVWARWDPVLIAATNKYLVLIQNDYLNVAYRLGVLLNDISNLAGQDPHSVASPGKFFIDFCTTLLNNAIANTGGHDNAVGPGPNHVIKTLTP